MPITFIDTLFLLVILFFFIFYWLFKNRPKTQSLILLSTCYLIYGYGDLILLLIIFISTIFNYFMGLLLGGNYTRKMKKIILFLCISLNVISLGVFKYFNFFSEGISNLLLLIGLKLNPIILNIILPIGISFYTLQVIAYNIDVFRGEIPATRNFINFAIFIAFFPKLTAGPIEHPTKIIPQIEKKKNFNNSDFSGAFQLILLGYFKKIVIADLIANQIRKFYEKPQNFTATEAYLIVLLFTIQIYADFSAYSDLARGFSKLFGIELMHNFNQPYLSTNIQEFWRRWHISLSEWFRDYLYKPLGGNRKGFLRLIINLMIIFVISGIWHGVGITFIIWGFLHGVFICIYRFNSLVLSKLKERYKNNIFKSKDNKFFKCLRLTYKFLGLFITFQLVCFAWIFFRAPDLETAMVIIRSSYFSHTSINLNFLKSKYFYLLVFSCFFVLIFDVTQFKLKRHEIFTNLHWLLKGVIYTFMIFMIIIFSNIFIEYEPFIYQGF